MAIVQSYFQPDIDRTAPLFSSYFNGFMKERTAMNMFLMKQFLDNSSPEFLDAQIKQTIENIQKLDESRLKIAEMDRKNAATMANNLATLRISASKANAQLAVTKQRDINNMMKAGFNAKKAAAKNQENNQNQLTLRSRLKDNRENVEDIFGVFDKSTHSKTVGNKTLKSVSDDPTGGDFLDRIGLLVDQSMGTVNKSSFRRQDPAMQKAYIAEIVLAAEKARDDGFYHSTIFPNNLLVNNPLRYNRFLKFAESELGVDLDLDTKATNIQRINNYIQQSDTSGKSAQEIAADVKVMMDNVAERKALVKKELLYKKLYRTKKEKATDAAKILMAEIKQMRSVIYAGVRNPYKDAKIIAATKPGSPSLYRHLSGENYDDPLLADIDKRIKEQTRILEGLNVRRADFFENRLSGADRFFKGFDSNYLLESPFKRPDQATKVAQLALDSARKELATPTGAKSKTYTGLDVGKPYRVAGGMFVGISKDEVPFYQTGPKRPPKIVTEQNRDYDYVTGVLKRLDKQIKATGLKT